MSLASGAKLGPYEILSPLGAGGMGEVYRARDSKLGREVAIKVLPEEFTQHPQKLARFEREARLLAALNHPRIATLYGVEEAENQPFLVMELVEGETLADRIARGPVPVEEALQISQQIAEALEAAHEKGVIHRDLKPANVKVDPEGKVKVLDFGLAKAFADEVPESELSQSPTLSRDATRAGVILGTAAYMSPEQAKGKTVDKRSDIFSFGIVLYEMLTGKRAFAGEDVSEVLAAIIRAEPDWKALPKDVPSSLAKLLRRCLTKDRKNRLRDVGEARFAVQEILASPEAHEASGEAKPRTSLLPWAIAAALGVGFVAAIWIPWQAEELPPPVLRLSVDLGEDIQYYQGRGQSVAISPNGEMLAFAGRSSSGSSQIYIRRLDSLEVTALTGTEGAMDPFFSPDGQWLGFFTARALKKVSVSGGGAQTIADLPSAWGGTWGPDDTIVYTPAATSGLYRVPASGGTPVELTTLEDGETTHRWPWFLPNGKAVLLAVSTASFREASIEAVLLETGERKVLQPGGASPRFATSGHLLYVRDETMFAMPFDADRVEPVGEPIPVIEGIPVGPAGEGNYAVAGNGSLVYDPSGSVDETARTLVWVDRQGREESLTDEPQAYNEFTLSPDGTQLAVRMGALSGENPDVWVHDLVRGTRTRLTFDRGTKRFPLWTPDGQRVAFGGNGIPISWKAADGTGEVEPLVDRPTRQYPQGFSPDGSLLVFEDQNAGGDLGVLSMEGERSSKMLLQTEFAERNAILSPDGRWVAYQSDESGQVEIYVRPFPDVDTRRFPVSNDGGKWPLWGPDGRELFYFGPAGLVSVSVETEPTFALGSREALFDAPYLTRGGNRRAAIHPDGQRFLLLKEVEGSTDTMGPRGVVLVLNWFEELNRLVPTE